MAVESAVVAPLALVAIVILGLQGNSTVTDHGTGYLVLVLLTGPLTAIPLLLFGAAATRVSMTTLGLLNYLTPVIQFLLGTAVFHEHMSPVRWAGFALVWLALAVFTTDSLTNHRRTRTTNAHTDTPPPNYLAPPSLVPLPSKDDRSPRERRTRS
jgi:chloramphenicol-sensitive protein RarD